MTEEIEINREESLKKIENNIKTLKSAGLIGYKNDPLENVNIDSEYELILDKKSELSSNKRKMVCARHAYFQELEERRLINEEEE